MTEMPEIIATHQSEWTKGQVTQNLQIRIYRPTAQPTGEWACRVVIDFHTKHDHAIYGEDSFQSLKLVFAFVKTLVTKLIAGWEAVGVDSEDTQKYTDAFFS